MTMCPSRNPASASHSGCRCIGDPGHKGRHWCLLGHAWDADESEEGE